MPRLSILPLVILIGCGSPEQAFDRAATEQEVRQMLDEYHRAMEEEGLLSEFRYLDNHPDFFWIPPGYESKLDFDSVKMILVRMAPTIAEMELKWEYLDVYPLTSDIATFTGKLHSVTLDKEGNRYESVALETGTAVRRLSGWKLRSGQSRTID